MLSFVRLARMARPCPAPSKPFSASFFSTTTSKRPVPSNFFKQQPSTLVPGVRQARLNSGGLGPRRRFAANQFILKGFIGVNVALFGYSTYTGVQAKQGYIDNFKNYMQNWTMNLRDVKNGYWWQPATSMFSHGGIMHIGFNMLTFWSLGRMLCAMPITPGQFTLVVLGSGLSGSLLWLAQQELKEREGVYQPKRALGFSGAVTGTVTALACFMPREKIALFGMVNLPLWVFVTAYGLYDGYYLNGENSNVAHAGHLGGMAFGLAYYFLRLRKLRYPGSI